MKNQENLNLHGTIKRHQQLRMTQLLEVSDRLQSSYYKNAPRRANTFEMNRRSLQIANTLLFFGSGDTKALFLSLNSIVTSVNQPSLWNINLQIIKNFKHVHNN